MSEDTQQNITPPQKDHEITKLNRQADVLDQTRLRPPMPSWQRTFCRGSYFPFLRKRVYLDPASESRSRTYSSSSMHLIMMSE